LRHLCTNVNKPFNFLSFGNTTFCQKYRFEKYNLRGTLKADFCDWGVGVDFDDIVEEFCKWAPVGIISLVLY